MCWWFCFLVVVTSQFISVVCFEIHTSLITIFFLVISSKLHRPKVGGVFVDSKNAFVFLLGHLEVCIVKFRRFQILQIKVKISKFLILMKLKIYLAIGIC